MQTGRFFAALVMGWALLSSISFGYSGGTGDPNNPYQIADANDLLELAADPNNYDKSFILTADIDLGSRSFTMAIIAPDTKNSMGNIYYSTPFTGIFDGGGYKITNFSINGGSNRYLGLFGFIGSSGHIKKLGIENYTIVGTSSRFIGGLTGYNCYGTISQCYTNGSVSLNGSGYAGGLIGTNYYGTVNHCYTTGAISIYNSTGYTVGGFIGSNSNGIVSHCYTACSIFTNYYPNNYPTEAGGFIGRNTVSSVVTRCFWDVQTVGFVISGINYDEDTSYPYADIRGRITAQMKDINTFLSAEWDFVYETVNGTQDIWAKPSGQYPYLAWQIDNPPELAAVPDVVSSTKTDAQDTLVAAGLDIWATNVYSDAAAAGTVVNQNPSAGTTLLAGVKVNVEISIGSYTGPGSGTETDPYKIGTAAEWQSLMYTSANWNKYFILIADIDFWNISLGPIGVFNMPFTGSFDGKGHVVSNIIKSGGLFGTIVGARVMNLTIMNAIIGGYDSVGGLVSSNSGYISNCYFDGMVRGNSKVGGLVGQNNPPVKDWVTHSGYIIKCHTSGYISGNTDVGGLVGYNSSTVENCYSSAAVIGGVEVGGLTGISGGFSNCYATGNVTGITKVGGLSGYGGGNSNCYATGAVTGRSFVGGLVGNLAGDLIDTYSVGLVSGSFSNSYYVGGLAGYKSSSAVVTSSFWNTETSGQTTSAGGTGKTTAEMRTLSTLTSAGWDFTPNWIDGDWQDWVLVSEGVEYPKLNCQSVSVYHGGQGTVEDPYQIADVNDLLALSEAWWDWDKLNFVMTNDIDLKGIIFSRAVIAPDTSFSDGYQGKSFRGKFDGRGHKITNLTITSAGNSYIGLFGYLSTFYYIESYRSEVKNLTLENFSVSGNSYVGGLLGYDSYGNINNCYVNGSASGTSYVGGLLGYGSYTNISNCYVNSSASGTSYIGGLAGSISNSSINTCSSNSSVNGSDHVGGLTGGGGNINNSCSISTVAGTSYVGGLTGAGGTLTNCYTKGMAVVMSSGGQYIGGLTGYSAGGIANCYAASVVCGSADTGGLVGYKSSGTGAITNSFWDMEISGMTTSAGGTGKTTAQMKTLSTYIGAGWDFSDTDGDPADWGIPNGDYPRLTWQPTTIVPDITGMPFKNAVSTILSAGFSVGDFNLVYDGSIPVGTILSQSPPAGTLTVGDAAVDYRISFAGWQGEGTSDIPYQITSPVDLLALSKDPNSYNKHFNLTNNLDLCGLIFDTAVIAPDANSVSGFQGTAFTGVFDGNGHKISHFTIQTGGNGYLGLFGFIDSGGQVKNLGLEDIKIKGYYGSNYVGGLAGFNNSGTVQGCYSMVDISCNLRIGGLVGENKSTVSNSYSMGSVHGYAYVGGLAGENNSSMINNCYSTGFVSASSEAPLRGGLIGYNYNAAVQSSFWDIQASGQPGSAGGTGKTTAEMKTLSTFISAEWDFIGETANGTTDYWKMRCEGVNYPKLSWQVIPTGDFTCPDGVGTEDLEYFTGQWMMENCTADNNYCGGVDVDNSGRVDLADYAILAEHWLEGVPL